MECLHAGQPAQVGERAAIHGSELSYIQGGLCPGGAVERRLVGVEAAIAAPLVLWGVFSPLNKFKVAHSLSPFAQCLRLPNNSEQRQKAIAVEFASSAEEISLQQIYLVRSVWMFSVSGNRPSAEVSPVQNRNHNHNHNHNHACIPTSIRCRCPMPS